MRRMYIGSPSSIKWVAKQIAKANNRGYSSTDKLRTVLRHLRYDLKVRNLKQLNEEHRERFISYLQNSELSRRTTSTYISYWNRIAEYAGKPELRISAKEHELSRGSFKYVDRTVSKEAHEAFTNWLHTKYEQTQDIRYEALRHSVELQREFGLRASESFCIKIIEKDISNGHLHLDRHDSTKNARERDVPVYKPEQEEKFKQAQDFARSHSWQSLIPPDNTKQEWIKFAYRTAKEFKREYPEYRDYHFHGERHAFAQDLFNHLIQERLHEKREDEADRRLTSMLTSEDVKEIRQQVSEALGHSREEITRTYGV